MNPLFSYHLTAEDVKYELVNLKQLVFEVTDACNLRCRYCIYGEMYHGFDKRASHFLSFNEAKTIIDYLAELWNSNANAAVRLPLYVSFYGGEPLMNVHLIKQIVEYMRSLRIPKKLYFSLTTNCVLLDRYLEYLVDNNFYVLFSLDGASRSNAYRLFPDGSPSYDKVFANIKEVQMKYPDYFVNNVQFNSVLHNLNDVPFLISFFKKEFEKVPIISELSSVGVRKDQKSAFMKSFRSMISDINNADSKEELMKDMGYDSPYTSELLSYFSTSLGNVFDTYSDLLSPDTEIPKIPSGTCLPFSRKLFVKVDGKILPCERIPHKYSFGFIKEGVLVFDLQDVADRFNSYINRIKPTCAVCASKFHCHKCLYTIEDSDSDSLNCNCFTTQSQLDMQEDYFRRYLYRHPSLYREFMKDMITN